MTARHGSGELRRTARMPGLDRPWHRCRRSASEDAPSAPIPG
jgi:hypothetical protein